MRGTFILAGTLLALASVTAGADELSDYVRNCATELNFTPSEVPPALNCNNGLVFNTGFNTPINDVVGHARINSSVDLVFACRWLTNRKPAYSPMAISVELLIHNRNTGGTCFFAAKDPTNPPDTVDPQVSTSIVAPTDANASSYWMSPTALEVKRYFVLGVRSPTTRLRCVGCHVAGPYVASNEIAPFLAQFGLLNDGHDTFARRYYAVNSPFIGPNGESAFMLWNNAIQGANSPNTCAFACHSIGTGSTAGHILDADGQFFSGDTSPKVISSLQEQIQALTPEMPPGNPAAPWLLDRSLNYRWVNMNSPYNNPAGEFETLSDLSWQYPAFYCANPTRLEAHVVDSDEPIRTNEVPDKLKTFNLQDGLVCLNQDQPSGRCQDYQVRYMCNGKFTAFQNNDTPGGSGDWETRTGFKNLCANPTWIQTRYMSGGSWVYVNGPADRLAEFDTNGLICNNSAQNNGQCSNYVVRFSCPQ